MATLVNYYPRAHTLAPLLAAKKKKKKGKKRNNVATHATYQHRFKARLAFFLGGKGGGEGKRNVRSNLGL